MAAADSTPTAARGAVLAAAFCVGLGSPFIVAAIAFARFRRLTQAIRRHQRAMTIMGSLLLIAMGVGLVLGVWEDVAYWVRDWAARLSD
jgi:cytochrome c-type biogenesis protein